MRTKLNKIRFFVNIDITSLINTYYVKNKKSITILQIIFVKPLNENTSFL